MAEGHTIMATIQAKVKIVRTVFPGSLDNFANPGPDTLLNSPATGLRHDQQHVASNDAIEALEAKVGVTGSADVNSLDYKITHVTGGVTDHGALTGLADDDHPQYTTDAEADAIADGLIASHASDPEAHHPLAVGVAAVQVSWGVSYIDEWSYGAWTEAGPYVDFTLGVNDTKLLAICSFYGQMTTGEGFNVRIVLLPQPSGATIEGATLTYVRSVSPVDSNGTPMNSWAPYTLTELFSGLTPGATYRMQLQAISTTIIGNYADDGNLATPTIAGIPFP